MKKWFKKITVTVLAVMIFSSLVSYTYAISEFVQINKYTSGLTYTNATNPVRKHDATDVAVELYNSGFAAQYRVRTMGCDAWGSNAVNNTYRDLQKVDYVLCERGYIYGINNKIYENGHSYAMIMVYPVGGGGMTTGYWSPDSVQPFLPPA